MTESGAASFKAFDVRSKLVEALQLDLVGPFTGSSLQGELLPQAPSRWYLTGFLAPIDADPAARSDEVGDEELDSADEAGGSDDTDTPEPPAARRAYFPSSIGLSLLVPAELETLVVTARWGDYRHEPAPGDAAAGGGWVWRREQVERRIDITVPMETSAPIEHSLPESGDVRLVLSVRSIRAGRGEQPGLPPGTRSVSLFLVNHRRLAPDETRDEAFVFQAELEVSSQESFVPRPDIRGAASDEWDEQVADLQYRDVFEFAVGHGVATRALRDAAESDTNSYGNAGPRLAGRGDGATCCRVVTTWIPSVEVERVAPSPMAGVELRMEVLSKLEDGAAAAEKLLPLVQEYRAWIEGQREALPECSPQRKATAEELFHRALMAADRIEAGIRALSDNHRLSAFRIANKAMARASRQRAAIQEGKAPQDVGAPTWRPFQLAFILMNLPGIADGAHADREIVDLLFFPTGGGKTEAYLGLAAFTLVYRRLTHPDVTSAGLSVLMRYTLRLLTLDQLGRAAALICALELEREADPGLGAWPFEIGLWVGKAATPNRMGAKGDPDPTCAYRKTIAFLNDDRKPAPIPLEECPWCGTKFKRDSFKLGPRRDTPDNLIVTCSNRRCEFTRDRPLPILGVDEPIYRRLPCFIIATVDKLAAMPWTGRVGALFGGVDRFDSNGFYGPCDAGVGRALPGPLPPPDLIIQDELHLISGPLGTIAGLYECAIDALCSRGDADKRIRPKIIASTATVRRAEGQIRALFGRSTVEVFPPPGPDRRDSFFAHTEPPHVSNARLYVGVAAPARSLKVVLLRVYLALLTSAQKAWLKAGGKKNPANPADPYMTLLGYFNSLRELGGSRRIVEDEVRTRASGYGHRLRVGEGEGLFADRTVKHDVVELTSRVSTEKIAEAKRELASSFQKEGHVDVALATNMISVGLDIVRLGLMVVLGQPKSSAEYIQATSRVGRDPERPGLVVTLLNVHKPRDRSHYERFVAYHESFYRSVEATSVTPFSPRALDRALAGTLVALARLGHPPMTPPVGAAEILAERGRLDFAVDCLGASAVAHARLGAKEAEKLRGRVRDLSKDLLDEWCQIAAEYAKTGTRLQYQTEVGAAQPLLHDFLSPDLSLLPPRHLKFRANRSMREVEPSVNLWVRSLGGEEIPQPGEEG